MTINNPNERGVDENYVMGRTRRWMNWDIHDMTVVDTVNYL